MCILFPSLATSFFYLLTPIWSQAPLEKPARPPQDDLPQQLSEVPTFDSKRAFDILKRQVQFGPRSPGSSGHQECLNYLQRELKKTADDVQLQQFPHVRSDGKRVLLTNVIAAFRRDLADRMLLSAHWDTRPWADQDPDPKNRKKPILGANDGASGVAVLLEVARHLKRQPPPIGVDIVLFDGEDLGTTGQAESFSVGARYFAGNRPAGFHPRFGINIDMVGDRELRIFREVNSDSYARTVVNEVFNAARDLNVRQFVDEPGSEITDDHLPLNMVGIPTINLIDFAYPDESNKYWHTLADTPDKCSPESLASVGKVLLTVIYLKSPTLQ